MTDRIPNADYDLYSTDDCKRIINNLGREPTSFTTFTNTQRVDISLSHMPRIPSKKKLGEAKNPNGLRTQIRIVENLGQTDQGEDQASRMNESSVQ